MKYTYFRYSLIILAVFFSVSKSLASSTYYYAALKAQVSTSGTNGGKVYAGTSTSAGTYNSSSSTSNAQSSTTKDEEKTFYAFAQANSEYTFTGWTNTDGGTVVSTDNPYSVTVKCSSDDSDNPTTTTVYANFVKQATGTFSVTFNATENGTYTVKTDNGTTTVSTTAYTENQESGNMSATLTAIPTTGYKFYGWYTISGGIKTYMSYNATYDATFSDNTSVYAEFIDKNIGLFQVGTSTTKYKGLQAALNVAGSSTTTITLVDDGTVGEGTYTIPANITLLIPFDDAHTFFTKNSLPTTSDNSYDTPSPYKTLTLANGAIINVNGTISVSAKPCAASGGSYKPAGGVNGKYGCINMEDGSQINLSAGAYLYAWGYIIGNGEVTANSGSYVYEYFQFTDFRGGTALTKIVGNSQKVFPISQYYIQNIEAPLIINYGAQEHVYSCVYAGSQVNYTGDVTFIGTTAGMFKINSGSLKKSYDPSRDRQIYSINGSTTMGSINLSVNGFSVSSSDYVLPLTNNISVTLEDGTLSTSYDMALLPGLEMTIKEGADFNIASGKSVYVYDLDEWKAAYGYDTKYLLNFSPTRTYTRSFTDLKDVEIDVQGTITANGYLYTTQSGANICCTQGNGGSITMGNGAGTSTTTYQAVQSGSSISYDDIAITSAQLHNGNDSYTATTSATAGTTYYYDMIHDLWGTTKVTIEKGDVNLSGTVNVADIATLANIILGHGPERHGVTDINADGTVDVEDVKALTNIILGK